MCPAIPISTIYGSRVENWNASAYAALAGASRLSGLVREQHAIFAIARETWKVDNRLRHFLDDIYKAVQNPPSPPPEPVSAEQIVEAANTCRKLHQVIDQLYTRAKSKGLTNRAFIGAALNSVKVRGEEILEIGEALDLSLNPDVDSLLDRSIQDVRDGKMFDLPTFK